MYWDIDGDGHIDRAVENYLEEVPEMLGEGGKHGGRKPRDTFGGWEREQYS